MTQPFLRSRTRKPYPEVGQRWRNVKSGRVAEVTHVGPDSALRLSEHRLILRGHNYGPRWLNLATLHENYRIEEGPMTER